MATFDSLHFFKKKEGVGGNDALCNAMNASALSGTFHCCHSRNLIVSLL